MKNIVETLQGDARFKTLVQALTVGGLLSSLDGEGPFTVFAPTEEAHQKIGTEKLDALIHDGPKLTQVLKYHVLKGLYTSTDLEGQTVATTLLGEDLDFRFDNGQIKVDGAHITESDIAASNGVIHVIDSVLIPEEAAVLLQS